MGSMYVSRCHIKAGWEDGDGLWDEYGFQDGNGKGLGLGNY